MFGIPGGEILDFIEAARIEGIEFILTRHEGAASFMADVTGQILRTPGVCVSTLGPGAVNMTLGVANAYLDRSPLIAITASLAHSAQPFATHQNLDLNAVYRPFTKLAITLDGQDTAAQVRRAYRTAIEPRMGPVHIALPSDVARCPDRQTQDPAAISVAPPVLPAPAIEALEAIAAEIRLARRPVVILGLDLDPRTSTGRARDFVEKLGVPTFVTPKAKGILAADHPYFCGVCAGVSGDAVIIDFFSQADLLIGVGFDPVESDKLWHQTLKLISIAPVSIAEGEYRPHREVTGDLDVMLDWLCAAQFGPFEWSETNIASYRRNLDRVLRPPDERGPGLSPYEVTVRLRRLLPRDTIFVTDVGTIKSITSQCWDTFDPLTFFESNGLSAMSYGFPGAMAAKLLFPNRTVVCVSGDGGMAMAMSEINTCVRHAIHFVTLVYNNNCLNMIKVEQKRRGYPTCGVDLGAVNFASVAQALGGCGRRVTSLEELEQAVLTGLRADQPVVIDVPVDATEY